MVVQHKGFGRDKEYETIHNASLLVAPIVWCAAGPRTSGGSVLMFNLGTMVSKGRT